MGMWQKYIDRITANFTKEKIYSFFWGFVSALILIILGYYISSNYYPAPFNEQIHNVKKYTCLDNTDKRVVSFFGSSIMDNQELRYTDHLSIEKKQSKAGKLYYIWKLEL